MSAQDDVTRLERKLAEARNRLREETTKRQHSLNLGDPVTFVDGDGWGVTKKHGVIIAVGPRMLIVETVDWLGNHATYTLARHEVIPGHFEPRGVNGERLCQGDEGQAVISRIRFLRGEAKR